VPIVPIIIRGIADKPRKGSLVMRPGKIDIYCLDVIYPDEYSGKSVAGLKKHVRKIMEKAIAGYEES
jgi:1-acyl-sn-glycerol-3-phosphate acyltransferase